MRNLLNQVVRIKMRRKKKARSQYQIEMARVDRKAQRVRRTMRVRQKRRMRRKIQRIIESK